MKLFDLSGRVAVITGGNGGIGLGMAKGMAAAGATIVVAGRDAAKNSAAVKELEEAGGQASAIPVDVLKEDSCRGLIDQTVKAHGRLDILVNNAGMSIRKQPDSTRSPNGTRCSTAISPAPSCAAMPPIRR